jgi:hypothetical protein
VGRENLSEQEIAAYNSALETGDKAKINLAVTGLYAKFTNAEGRPAQARIRGEGKGGNVTPFKSSEQVVEAMRDARYATDPAYRDEVAQRLAVSDV